MTHLINSLKESFEQYLSMLRVQLYIDIGNFYFSTTICCIALILILIFCLSLNYNVKWGIYAYYTTSIALITYDYRYLGVILPVLFGLSLCFVDFGLMSILFIAMFIVIHFSDGSVVMSEITLICSVIISSIMCALIPQPEEKAVNVGSTDIMTHYQVEEGYIAIDWKKFEAHSEIEGNPCIGTFGSVNLDNFKIKPVKILNNGTTCYFIVDKENSEMFRDELISIYN